MANLLKLAKRRLMIRRQAGLRFIFFEVFVYLAFQQSASSLFVFSFAYFFVFLIKFIAVSSNHKNAVKACYTAKTSGLKQRRLAALINKS